MAFSLVWMGEGEKLRIKAESPHLSMAEAPDAILLGGGRQLRSRTGHLGLQ